MILIRAIAFLLHFTIVPMAFGSLITYKLKDSTPKTVTVRYIVGLLGSFGVFFIINCIFTWWQNFTMIREAVVGAFGYLSITYSIVAAVVVAVYIFLERKSLKKVPGIVKEFVLNVATELKKDKLCIVYLGIFLLIFGVQLYFSFGYEVNEWSYDDFDYVVISQDDITFDMLSNTSVVTGERPFTEPKRSATSWPAYIAYLAKISGFEVTTVCHTILPVILLFVAYLVFWYMAKETIDGFDNRLIFMCILATIFTCGNFSHYNLAFRLLCTLWQGKALLCGISLPFFMVFIPKLLSEKIDKAVILPVFAISLGTCSFSTMSALLVGMFFTLMFVTMSIYHKKIYGISIFVAGLLGPILQLGVYQLISMLLVEQQTWGKIWFGSNL